MTKTLLHTCCAPCSVACIQLLRAEGIEPVSYWYNPNIHPYQEYKARRDTLMDYAPSVGVELIVQEDYGLRDFCRAVAEDIDHRRGPLYRPRPGDTAVPAAATATACGWSRPPAMRLNTDFRAFPAPYLSAHTRTMSCCVKPPRRCPCSTV